MMKADDMVGLRFGEWTVLRRGKPTTDKAKGVFMVCQCSCGEIRNIRAVELRAGNSTSCGHTHEMSNSPEYNSWRAMIQRCTNPNNNRFYRYGARGITVCDEWRSSFEAFYRDMGPRPEGMTLDRIDNDGNYEPGNCKWSTPLDQRLNQGGI